MRSSFLNRIVPAFTLVVALTSLPAAASPYTSMVVFGDSLSDSGNVALVPPALGGGSTTQTITGNTYVPNHPYDVGTFSGAFSNGPVWATTAANALTGVPLTPSLAGGTNYAFGGATSAGLVQQAGVYFAMNSASPTALYVVAGGGNDARAVLQGADLATTITSYVQNISLIVSQLENGGAKHIIVWDTPNVGLAPAVAAQGGTAVGTTIATLMNQALFAAMANFTDVSIFDIFGLGTSIFQDPGKFGLTNVTDACGAIALADCSKYEYWDGIHPTTAAHTIIADAFIAQAVPELSTWAMLILGFGGVGFMAYRRRQNGSALAAA
jgi:outer membrane lipase/esterase